MVNDFKKYKKYLKDNPKHLRGEMQRLEAKVEKYVSTTDSILNRVFASFIDSGFFKGLSSLGTLDDELPKGIMYFTGIGFKPMENMGKDDAGKEHAAQLVSSAQKHKIPISQCPRANFVLIKDGEKTEDGPKLLLLALSAHALERNHPDLAKLANDAATEVKSLIKDFHKGVILKG